MALLMLVETAVNPWAVILSQPGAVRRTLRYSVANAQCAMAARCIGFGAFMEDIVALIDARAKKRGRRGPYKKKSME